MQERHYKNILYFIILVIGITFTTQVYWNIKNYHSGKEQLIRDVQRSLDESVDLYYLNRAEENLLGFSIDEKDNQNTVGTIDSITKAIDFTEIGFSLDSLVTRNMKSITVFKGSDVENINQLDREVLVDSLESRDGIKISMGDLNEKKNNLAKLTTRIIFSMSTDSLNLAEMDSLIGQNLKQKNIPVAYGLKYKNVADKEYTTNDSIISNATLKTVSQSTYLHKNTTLELAFTNETKTILQRNLLGILLSFFLITAIIASLLYLLKIIKEQKQLAEIKNDFISNITHEFKTPIATISAAVEGIRIFNADNDPKKTEKYLDMSTDQLDKLNTMVERILDTATLDKEDLALQKSPVNITELLQTMVAKYESLYTDIPIYLSATDTAITTNVDIFHLENALDNIIDNAYKYGKPPIEIQIQVQKKEKQTDALIICIKDHGMAITKDQASMIFEKFYRVPKGNTHDIKGFGIGLYYTKTIIEKHHGTIKLTTSPKTTFTITLPYV